MEQIHIEANQNMFVSKSISNIEVVVQPGTSAGVSQDTKQNVTQVTTEVQGIRGGGGLRETTTKEKRRRVAEKQPFMGD